MSTPSGTFTLQDLSLFFDDNPNQTQEISHVGEQNFDKEMGKSSHTKQKKLRSDVWKIFEKCKDENGKDLAKCSLCEKLFDGSSKKGTTHLRNHFKSCQNKRNEGGASGSGDKPAGNSVTDQQLDHLEGVKTLIKKQCFTDLPKQVGDGDIIKVYDEEKEKLRMYFKKFNCRFSLMIKNISDGKSTAFRVRFINDDWKLEEKTIGLKCIEGDQNMKVLKNVLSDLGIDNKIYSMVTDERENRFSGQGSLLSNCKFCFRDVKIICTPFLDELITVLIDHISKICNYITETSLKIGTFQIAAKIALGKEVTAEDIQKKKENVFGWDPFKTALGLREAFFELENMDPDFKSINLTKEQWDEITTFYQSYEQWDTWNSLRRGTANMHFHALCGMYKISLVLVTLNPFISGERYLRFARDAKKCWDPSNLILAVAAVLDPRFKMDIVKHWYEKIYGDECETQLAIFTDYFTGVYNEYAKGTNNFQSSASGSKEKKSFISYTMLDISGNYSRDPYSGQSLNIELHLYLKEVNFPLIHDFDILEWWQFYSRYFPTLAKMARDFLSIQIVAPKEYLYWKFPFSRKNFDSDIVNEAFVCTINWLTN